MGTGLIENAAKNGWMKVTAGLIAGKQFILYRNPTFIGSGLSAHLPFFATGRLESGMQPSILLPAVSSWRISRWGARPLSMVNPLPCARLRSGDEIKIGMTSFRFQEKRREKK